MKSIFKKQEALNQYNKIKDVKAKSSLMLFQEDIDKAGSKKFYITDPKTIFKKIEKSAEPHFYEFWSEKTKMCFSVDIDYDMTKNNIKPDQLLEKVIEIVFQGAEKYYNYKYKLSDVIILENDKMLQELDNPNKYSSHIIFRGLSFENVTVCKDFYLRLNKDFEISKLYVDKAIYNLTCLRMFLNSKMGRNAILVTKYIVINGETTQICNMNGSENDLYNFFLKTLITYTISTDKMIGVKEIKNKAEANLPKNDGLSDISNINIEHILESLPSNYYNDYDNWIKIGMILHSYHSTSFDTFNIWNNWSQKSNKYLEKEMKSKWKSFAQQKSKLSIGTLIKWASDEGIENIYKNAKQNIDDIVINYPMKPIQIDLSIIKDNQLTQLSQEKLTPEIYEPLMKTKLVAVQSEKGTGKTSNLFKTMFENNKSWINNDTSILFISSRITFGYKLLGDLKDYGFELYSQIKDHQIYSKRVICQLDSLMRLERDSYDIIIVDECESVARYITSNHFTKNNKASMIISNLEMRLADANQVYILDADLSDRCINYYKKIIQPISANDFHLIINNFKPYSEYKIIYSQYATWIRQIRLKLQDNKRIVVAMASNAKAKDLDHMLKDYFPEKKILLIHKETSDDDKRSLLLNVNDEWSKYDIIIYTPSVCMGVSFDIDGHFDYIFAYGCHESLGAQEWCQMIHRIRSPINKEIYISIDQYKPFSQVDDLIDYKTIERMLCSDYYLTNYDLHNNLVTKKLKRIKNQNEANKFNNLDAGIDSDNDLETSDINTSFTKSTNININDKIIFYPYKEEPIYDLYVRNSWEQIENRLNFPASFFGYAKFKEYKMEYLKPSDEDKEILKEMKDIRSDREDHELEEKISGITEAEELSQDEYNIKVRQKDVSISKEDIYAIQKYNLRKCYSIYQKTEPTEPAEPTEPNISNGDITKDFVAEYHLHNRMKHYRNLATILATSNQTTQEKLDIIKDNQQYDSIITNCYIDFTNKNKYSYHYYALEIIKLAGFNINDLSIKIPYPNLITNIYDTIAWCDEFKDELSFKYDLKTSYKSLTELQEIEQLKYINRIIESQYGLKIKRINHSTHKDNILYKLDDNGIWDNLPERNILPEYIIDQDNNDHEDNNELPINIYDLKRKIIPTEIKQKRIACKNNYDTSVLDIFDDDE